MASDTISTPLDLVPAEVARDVPSALGETLRRCEETGRSVFLLGGDAASIRLVRERVVRDRPRLRVAGICDADFSGPAGAAILGHVASCKPDVVVVDLSAARHRALIAEVAAAGLRFTLVNRPGSFARYARGRDGGAPLAAWPRPARKAATTIMTLMRFAGIVLRQASRHAGQAARRPTGPHRQR